MADCWEHTHATNFKKINSVLALLYFEIVYALVDILKKDTGFPLNRKVRIVSTIRMQYTFILFIHISYLESAS